ncbi:MAG: hypothetical protein R8K47_04245 [Mariprofundaceae bacterium]
MDAVVVGADRIAANGDVANKLGTHALALAARTPGVPFFVAAPSTWIVQATPSWTSAHAVRRAPCHRGRVASTQTNGRSPSRCSA